MDGKWVFLSSGKKVKYNNDNKTISIFFRRINNPPLILQMYYRSFYLIETICIEYPHCSAGLQEPNNHELLRKVECNEVKYIRKTNANYKIWMSPLFSREEVSQLLTFVKKLNLGGINFDEYSAVILNNLARSME